MTLAALVTAGVASLDVVGFAQPRTAAITLVTFAFLSVLVAGSAALAYRWYFRTEIPEGVAALLGVSVVALYLNTTSLGAIAFGEDPGLLTPETVFFNVVSLGVAAAVASAGRYVGDRLAVDVFALSGAKQLEGELSGIVRAVGRFTAVTLPEASEINDMDTYDLVSVEKKEELAGKTLLFARKLSGEQLREKLVDRVKQDYGVSYVDVDIAADGTVEYFAVGSRAAGLGPTLAPGSAAVAVVADPPNNATAGDMVQVWQTAPETRRVATGELRGVAGDAVTVALDESDAEKLAPEGPYRLVTLPAETQADREFASLLRNADETMAAVEIGVNSELDGRTVGNAGVVVVAVRPAEGSEGSIQPIPPRAYTFDGGDLVYLVARPDAIRRFEAAAKGSDGGGTVPAAERDSAIELGVAVEERVAEGDAVADVNEQGDDGEKQSEDGEKQGDDGEKQSEDAEDGTQRS